MAKSSDKTKSMRAIPAPTRSRISTIRRNLLAWYDGNKRDLPWRIDTDPYRIWISEIMLQQTRVDQAAPYFNRFMSAFPTVQALARNDLDSVIKQWEGLGYYSRARNIHAAASMVCEQYKGYLPNNVADLKSLPGIGSYTAGAIASIAFDVPVPAVDGNVARVLSRLFTIDLDTKDASARRRIEPLAQILVDKKRPGDFNQSIMELGATICTPTSPSCNLCPVSGSCFARKQRVTDDYPRQEKRRAVPSVKQIALVAVSESGLLSISKRAANGLLAGLWEFPGVEISEDESIASALEKTSKEYGIRVGGQPEALGTIRHAYSHFKVTVDVYVAPAILPDSDAIPDPTNRAGARITNRATSWRSIGQLSDVALTGVTKKVLALFRKNRPQTS